MGPSAPLLRFAPRRPRLPAPRRAWFFAACITSSAAGEPPAPEPTPTQPAAAVAGSEAPADTGEPVKAADTAPDPADLIADDLLLFADVPVVVSASRSATPITLAAVPITILDQDFIHFSGHTDVADLLRFTPGVDVLRLDRNRTAMGIRGMHFEFSDRTLTLIDGRNANNPIYGGADFSTLPLFAEDIERIEVVRGPGGGAWGANAFNGVINIIQKKPEDLGGVLLTSTLNQYGDLDAQGRFAFTRKKLSLSTSVGWHEHDSSTDVGGSNESMADDFGRRFSITSEGVYRVTEDARVRFGAAHARNERGAFEFAGTLPQEDFSSSVIRLHAGLERDLDDGSFYIRWFGNFDDNDNPQFWGYRAAENDLELQITRELNEKHSLTLGGNIRSVVVDFENRPGVSVVSGGNESAWWLGLFGIHRYNATDTLTFETQLRADYYSETSTDWSARLAALYALDPKKEHILRAAVAKSFRAPLAATRGLDGQQAPIAAFPGLYGLDFIENDNLDNEQIYAIEAGYAGEIKEWISIRIDGYYHRYEDLIGFEILDDPLSLGRQLVQFQNIAGADGYGFETELTFSGERFSISPWYAFNFLNTDEPAQSIRGWKPATHTAGIRTRFNATDKLTLASNYRAAGVTHSPDTAANGHQLVGQSHILDLTASYKFNANAELLIGVHDLLDSSDDPVRQAGSLTGVETPGRTLLARLQIRF